MGVLFLQTDLISTFLSIEASVLKWQNIKADTYCASLACVIGDFDMGVAILGKVIYLCKKVYCYG